MNATRIRRAFAAALLLLAAPACNLTLDLRTTVEEDGGGRFEVVVSLDRELVQALGSEQVAEAAGGGVERLDEYFACLGGGGWETSRAEPDGGLRLSASRAFDDPAGFDEVLVGLRCGEAAGELELANVGLEVDYAIESSAMRRRTTFSGTVDLGAGIELDEESRRQLEMVRDLDVIVIRILADLPGEVTISSGDGAVEDGVAVWRPPLGERMSFAASSSSLRTGTVLLIAIPGLAALGGIAWWIAGRRRKGTGDLGVFADPAPPAQ